MLLRSASLALAASLAIAPVAASADTAKPVAAEVVSVKTPAPATQQDSTNYAAREQQDKQASNYEGGNVVVIGASGCTWKTMPLPRRCRRGRRLHDRSRCRS